MLTIYTTPLSANGRKVMAVSQHLGLDPEIRLVNVYKGEGQTPEYLAINSTGKIPTLVDDQVTLSESNAILQYLAEVYGNFALWSRNPAERAAIASWLFWESAHWQPALSDVLSGFVGHKLRPEVVPTPENPPDWDDDQLRPLLLKLNTHTQDSPYLAGETITIADYSVAGMMTYFRSAGFPFASFPHLATWYERLEASEGWQKTAVELWSR